MHVRSSPEAEAVVAAVRERRSGTLTITLSGGCCDSTAPFLFEDHLVGRDWLRVGAVGDVDVWASPQLVELWGDDELVLSAVEDPLAESFSVETDLGRRLVLRAAG